MAIIDWEAAYRRDGYGPEPVGAIPECDRNGSSPKALAAWGTMSDEEKQSCSTTLGAATPRLRSLSATRCAPTGSESWSRANARNAAAPSPDAATRRHRIVGFPA